MVGMTTGAYPESFKGSLRAGLPLIAVDYPGRQLQVERLHVLQRAESIPPYTY